jgi:hypothetical protein
LTVLVSQNRWIVSLMHTSLDVFLSNSTCSFHFKTIGDSNLVTNKNIFILMFIGKDVYLKVYRTKL